MGAALTWATSTPVVLGDGFSRVFGGTPDAPAALYAGPSDLADVLVEVLTDDTLRNTPAGDARGVAAGFTWPATAAATLATYRKT